MLLIKGMGGVPIRLIMINYIELYSYQVSRGWIVKVLWNFGELIKIYFEIVVKFSSIMSNVACRFQKTVFMNFRNVVI
jgi:hypothetical protein